MVRAAKGCGGGLLPGESRCLSTHLGEDDSSRESRACDPICIAFTTAVH